MKKAGKRYISKEAYTTENKALMYSSLMTVHISF